MHLTLQPNKCFEQDIIAFKFKLKCGINFSFSKYADGEWAVIKNSDINNTEFWFDSSNLIDTLKRDKLIESFQFQHPQYYVGISCPCCQGLEVFKAMKVMSGQPDKRLTWANLWVNKNYQYYSSDIIPLFAQKKVILYCHKNGNINNLPFQPIKVFPIGNNAWDSNWNLIEKSKQYISKHKIEDHLFLFCCGPFGNILCHQLTEFNDKNTYLDIGSTLNPFLKSEGFVRDYYIEGSYFSQQQCVWG